MIDDLAFVLAVLFLIFVAPLWIILHYVTRWRADRRAAAAGARGDAALAAKVERLEARIAVLERILDADAPGWRDQR